MKVLLCEDADWLLSEEAFSIYASCMFQPTYEDYKAQMEDCLTDSSVKVFVCEHRDKKTVRGIPKIIEVYGKDSIDISDDTILVTIPFNRINKVGDKNLNLSQLKVLAEIRNNPNITKPELMIKCDLGKTSIDTIVTFLRKNNIIERIGSNKTGYWKVNE